MSACVNNQASQAYYDNNRGSGAGKLILLMILAAFVLFAALGVKTHLHAEARHGNTALAVRKCLEDNGPAAFFKARGDSTFYILCQMSKDRFGIQVVSKDGHEKTTFVRGMGTWRETQNYLRSFADVFRGQLPWLTQ